MTELTQVYKVGDRLFDTKAEATAFIQRPLIVAALQPIVGVGDQAAKIIDWLVENQDAVEDAFDTGTIKRVTKSDQAKIDKDKAASEDPANAELIKQIKKVFPFLGENLEVFFGSFRWPATTRMDDATKTAEMVKALTAASENEKLATYIVENREAIAEAYTAGKTKRTVSPNATNALAEYREKQKAEKAARAEAEAAAAAETPATT